MVATFNIFDTATSIAATAVITSSAVSTLHARGFYSILVILSGTAPSVDVAYQVSKEGSTFYAPIDGAGTDMSGICTTLTSTKSRQVVTSPLGIISIIMNGAGHLLYPKVFSGCK